MINPCLYFGNVSRFSQAEFLMKKQITFAVAWFCLAIFNPIFIMTVHELSKFTIFSFNKALYTTKSHINQIIPYYVFFLTKPNVYNTKTEYMFYLINLYTSVSSCFLENPTKIPEILTTKDIRVGVFPAMVHQQGEFQDFQDF